MHLFERDDSGKIVKMTQPDPDGAGPLGALDTLFNYNNDTQDLESVTLPDSATQEWQYDPIFHQVNRSVDELGRVTTYEIDPSTGGISSITRHNPDDPAGEAVTSLDVTTTFSYSPPAVAGGLPGGLPLTITDAEGRVARYEYYNNSTDTRFGRVWKITYADGTPDAGTHEFDYDAAGNVTVQIDPLGRRTDFTYDALNRLLEVRQPDPTGNNVEANRPRTQYFYDQPGNLVKVIDPNGNVSRWAYDKLNRVTEAIRPHQDGPAMGDGRKTVYTYDLAGQLDTVTELTRVTNYDYDLLGRVETITLPDPGAGSPVWHYTYGALGHVLTETDPEFNVTSYAYDNRLRVEQITLPDPDGDVFGSLPSSVLAYSFDAVGNLLTETRRSTRWSTATIF